MHTFVSADGSTRCSACGLHADMCSCRPTPVRDIAELIADAWTAHADGGDANVEHQPMESYVRLETDGKRFKVTVEESPSRHGHGL